jgi:fructose-1-phosphate kinase PfkB-like protein
MHKQCPSHNIKIILGEMNAKVGKKIWTGIAVGTCGLHNNNNDKKTCPINYAVRQCTVIGGHYSNTETYIKKHGTDLTAETVNQIDHVMNDQ